FRRLLFRSGPCHPRGFPECATSTRASADRQSQTPLRCRECRCAPSWPLEPQISLKNLAMSSGGSSSPLSASRTDSSRGELDVKRACLTSVSSPRPGDIYPSSNCPDRGRVPALCGSPFPKPLPPPIRNSPDRPMPLPHPAPDCKNQSPSERHRGLRTQLCSNRSREIRLTSEPPVRLFR